MLCGKDERSPPSFLPSPILHHFSARAASALPSPVSPPPRRPFPHSVALCPQHFRVSYPADVDERQAEHLLRLSESSRTDLLRRISAAGVSFQVPTLELFINETTGDFVGRTGQPSWAAAATRGNRVELQPLELLNRRRILKQPSPRTRTSVLNSVTPTPRWSSEGGLHISERDQWFRVINPKQRSHLELEQRFPPHRLPRARRLRRCLREVKRLIELKGSLGSVGSCVG